MSSEWATAAVGHLTEKEYFERYNWLTQNYGSPSSSGQWWPGYLSLIMKPDIYFLYKARWLK